MSDSKPEKCVIIQRPMETAAMTEGRDVDWVEAMASASAVDCVPVAATDPLYILYTSGTTGQPKGVVRDNGGHVVALKWTMKNIYNVDTGDVYWAASDVGWVVGHSYIVYGPLFKGCTTILFEGKPVGTPDAGVFWRVISDHKVKSMFTAPTAFRAIKREDPNAELMKKYDLSNFKALFLAGDNRPQHIALGQGFVESTGGGSLVADGNGLGDCRQLPGPARIPGKGRLTNETGSGMESSGCGQQQPAGGSR
jgi:propionyl-CoA synthetase